MLDRIAQTLRLTREEASHALSLSGILFGLMGSYTLVKTARDALFLAQLPAGLLPYVFLGVGALTLVVSALFARVSRNRPAWESLASSSMGAAVSLALFAYLFRVRASWVPIAFYLWVNVYGLILLSTFWAFTGSVLHPREAKRIFGIIGVGGILGGLGGGLAAAPLAGHQSLASLVLVAAAMLALLAPAVLAHVRRGHLPRPEPRAASADGVAPLAGHGYVRWLALAALCSVLVTTLVDYQFKVEIQRRYPTPAALGTFLGWFYTATNLAALAVQLLATRWALQVFGAGWSAAVLPAGLGMGASATLAIPGFASVMATRLWDQVMRLSINRGAVELFYFPLEPDLRRKAKAFIEAGLERVGDGLAGLVILAAGVTMGSGVHALAALVAGLVVLWVIAWQAVRQGYVRELGRNLRRMNLEPQHVTVSLREAHLLEEMARLLDSPFERIVLHSLTMLEENAPERITAHLPRLLSHASSRVRVRALSLAASLPEVDARIDLVAFMKDENLEVRMEAMRAYCALGGERRMEIMEQLAASDDPRLRRTALQCIAEYATTLEEAHVRDVLERALRDGDVAQRAAIAEGLGKRPAPSTLHDLIPPLLDDASAEVRNAAMRSAGLAQRRAVVPRLIDSLAVHESRVAAHAALASFGDRVTGTLGDYLADTDVPREVRLAIPRVLSAIATPAAVDALLRSRDREDVRLGYRVLKALNHVRILEPRMRIPREQLTEDLDDDIRRYLFAFVHYRSCAIGQSRSAERLLCIALNERMDQALNRIFRRLALIYAADDMYAAYLGVVSENPRMRGNALEYLENALAPDHRTIVMPLVDDSGDEGRLREAEARYGLRYVGYTESLQAMVEGADAWLKTLALYLIGRRSERILSPLVERQVSSPDSRVRETAVWALAALAVG